ncbi:MAG: acyltransferase family protein [Deltaproteobacteria bacterium]|nr:acyltransferase family protein [Deltaproteobacteria bacterium]
MKIAWIHYLRILAAFGVVLIHASENTIFCRSDVPGIVWEIANVCKASAVWTVPVFVMISGYLLLQPSWESALDFYRNRLKKLLIPFFAAVVFFSLITFIREISSRGASSGISFAIDSSTFSAAMKAVLWNFVTGRPFYHLWYLYMILGLFMLTPLLRKIVERLSRRSLGILCGCLLVVTIAVISYLSLVKNINCSVAIENAPFPVWFLPYLGYFFCGYFFRQWTFRISNWILIAIFVVSVAATAGLCSYFSAKGQTALGMFFYSFTGITVVPMALSIFLWFKNISFNEYSILDTLGNLTFGIYLIHPAFQWAAYVVGIFHRAKGSPFWIPASAVIVFAVSAAIVYILIHLTSERELEDMPMEERITMPPDERTSLF